MFIKEVLHRHRNDFSFICGCEYCSHTYRRGDGYADAYFCLKVVPSQHCPACGRNSAGQTPASAIEARSDATGTGAAVGESAVATGETPKTTPKTQGKQHA